MDKGLSDSNSVTRIDLVHVRARIPPRAKRTPTAFVQQQIFHPCASTGKQRPIEDFLFHKQRGLMHHPIGALLLKKYIRKVNS
jgi:hypothetical protein